MELPDIGRYRRRFIVEFGPEDSGLVDRMGVAHRTKRAAIIAGLRLLESGEVEQLRAQVGALEQELALTKGALAEAQRGSTKAAPALAKAKADLKAEKDAHKRTQAALTRADGSLREAQTALRRAETAIASLQAERDRLGGLLPLSAFCPSCDKLVPESEWAEQATSDGIDVYHQPHGYRTGQGLLSRGATILLQRPPRGQAPR